MIPSYLTRRIFRADFFINPWHTVKIGFRPTTISRLLSTTPEAVTSAGTTTLRTESRLDASGRWTSKLHKNVYPTPVQASPDSIRSGFTCLQLHPMVTAALEQTGKEIPTYIQRQSVPAILSKPPRHVLIASETGSGKTLAYLIPLLSRLKSLENASNREHSQSVMNDLLIGPRLMAPLILILQPTRELVDQALTVAKELSHFAKFRVRGVCGGIDRSLMEARLQNNPVDVLVATPGAVNRMMNMNKLSLSGVQHIVFDEADELLEVHPRTMTTMNGKNKFADQQLRFSDQLEPILKSLSNRRSVQHVYVAATVPNDMQQWLYERYNLVDGQELQMVRGQRLHSATSISSLETGQIKTAFIRVDTSEVESEDAKNYKLIEILTMALKRHDVGKVLIFCDHQQRRQALVEKLSHCLSSEHSAVHLGGNDDRQSAWNSFRNGDVKIAVCARSFARGIDDHDIRTVIMMDVPLTGSEYVHRVGRIRKGGRVYVLVSNNETPRAEALFLAHVKGKRIAGINPSSAWKDRLKAGTDRIRNERAVKKARELELARWVDERASKVGTFRGRSGRGVTKFKAAEMHRPRLSAKEAYRGVVGGKMKPKKKKKKDRYRL